MFRVGNKVQKRGADDQSVGTIKEIFAERICGEVVCYAVVEFNETFVVDINLLTTVKGETHE